MPHGLARYSAAQHSQSLEAWLVHVPGLVVLAPSTAYDAKGLMLAAQFANRASEARNDD